jgi:hypothetical protein
MRATCLMTTRGGSGSQLLARGATGRRCSERRAPVRLGAVGGAVGGSCRAAGAGMRAARASSGQPQTPQPQERSARGRCERKAARDTHADACHALPTARARRLTPLTSASGAHPSDASLFAACAWRAFIPVV